jgi:hypothetical protein
MRRHWNKQGTIGQATDRTKDKGREIKVENQKVETESRD